MSVLSDLGWIRASGRGTVYSYTIAQAPTHPAFREDVPYVVAIVELDEGPRLTTNIVGCDPVAMPHRKCRSSPPTMT